MPVTAIPGGSAPGPGTDAGRAGAADEAGGRVSALLSSRVALVGVLLIAFAVYAPSLNDWFSGDDFWFLRSAEAVPFGEYVVDSLDFRQIDTLPEFNRYRPLYPISWPIMYGAFGLDATGYHAVLIVLHLGSTVLVWLIAFRLTKQVWASNLAALIFAVHPAYATAVTWISGGNRVFVAFPYLLSLLLFMKYMDGGRRRGVYYLASFLTFIVAILYHSSALTLAVVLPSYAFLVSGTPRDALQVRRWFQFVPFAIVTVALAAIQVWVRDELGAYGFHFGWHQYSIYGQFLGLALFPESIVPRPGGTGGAEWLSTALGALGGIASVAMLVATVVLITQRRLPYLGLFVVLWVYASLLPDSTLLFPVNGRVLYMPGASLAIFLVVCIMWLRVALPASVVRPLARAGPVILVLVLVPAVFLAVDNGEEPGLAAAENERFVGQLREEVPRMESGAVLYVTNAPFDLVSFQGTRLEALVRLYYGDVEVRRLPPDQVDLVRATLGKSDRIFWFDR